jgi:hypothetical protein
MNGNTPQRLGRAFGLLVRYWACNMTLVHDQGGVWPGFGYSLSEQSALRTIARRVPSIEFSVWMTFVVVFTLLCLGGLTLFAIWLLASTRVGHSLESVSATTFLLNLGVVMVASLAVGFPAAMLVGSLLTGRLFGVSEADLPDAPVRAHYVHKLSFQLLRFAFLGSAVVVAMCLWLPDRIWLLTRCVLPVLGPAVSLAIALYYRFRIRHPDQAAVGEEPVSETRESPSSNP